VLRVKDANGFISDTFVGLRDNPDFVSANNNVNNIVIKEKSGNFPFLFIIISVLALIGLGIIIKTHVKISFDKK